MAGEGALRLRRQVLVGEEQDEPVVKRVGERGDRSVRQRLGEVEAGDASRRWRA